MANQTRPIRWIRALVAGQFLGCMSIAYTVVETLSVGGHAGVSMLDILRVAATQFCLGFVPGALLVGLSDIVGRRVNSARASTLLFWFTPVLGVVLGALFGLAAGRMHSVVDFAVLAVIVAGLGAGYWVVRRCYERPPCELVPVTAAWLAAAVAVSMSSAPRTGQLSPDLYLGAAMVAIASPILMVLNDVIAGLWADHGTKKRWRAGAAGLTAVACVGGVTAAWMLHGWSPGIYLAFKWLVFYSGTLVALVLVEPWLAGLLESAGRRVKATVIGLITSSQVVGAAAVGWMLVVPIPRRFGPHVPHGSIGLAASLLSQWSDADGDGYYARGDGGNDCDDTDPERRPNSPIRAQNCWVESAPKPRPGAPTKTGGSTKPGASTRPSGSTKPGPRPGRPRAEHAVIFVSDATRADLINDPGSLERFPHLQALAAESVVFERAYSPGNATLMSLIPMLSGVSPATLMQASMTQTPQPIGKLLSARWLFRTNRDEFCTAFVVQGHPYGQWLSQYYFPRPSQLDVANYDYAPDAKGHSGPLVASSVRQALDACAGRRLLMMVYVDDPHIEQPELHHTCKDGRPGGHRCYIEEVQVVDQAVGDVVALLHERGIWDKAMTIFTSDHGEAFGEHGYQTHASSVFDVQTHVPLLVRRGSANVGAGGEPSVVEPHKHKRVSTPVSLMGLKATLAQATGAPMPGPFPYPSWLALIDDPTAEYPAPITENWLGLMRPAWRAPTTAMVDGDWKLIYNWRSGQPQVYHLGEDPAERRDLSHARPGKTGELMQLFRRSESQLLTGWNERATKNASF